MVNLDLPILNRVKNILTKTEKIDTDVAGVLTKLAEQGVDIDSIITSIGTSGDQASAATIFGKLAGLASQSGGAVKSVQRGVARGTDLKSNVNVYISAVNPGKSIVIINTDTASNLVEKSGYMPYLVSLQSTVITFSCGYQKYQGERWEETQFSQFSWQIIEFN